MDTPNSSWLFQESLKHNHRRFEGLGREHTPAGSSREGLPRTPRLHQIPCLRAAQAQTSLAGSTASGSFGCLSSQRGTPYHFHSRWLQSFRPRLRIQQAGRERRLGLSARRVWECTGSVASKGLKVTSYRARCGTCVPKRPKLRPQSWFWELFEDQKARNLPAQLLRRTPVAKAGMRALDGQRD